MAPTQRGARSRRPLIFDIDDLPHHFPMQAGRFVDRPVVETPIRGEVDIVEFASKTRTRIYSPAKTVVLIKIKKPQNVPCYRARSRGIESHDERDTDVLLIEFVGGQQRRIRAKRMADQNDDVSLAARVSFADLRNRRSPGTMGMNAGAITVPVDRVRECIQATGKDVAHATEKLDPHVRRGLRQGAIDRLNGRKTETADCLRYKKPA
jgi:hypothetical protein